MLLCCKEYIMSQRDIDFYRQRIKQIGPWTGIRWLRNQGMAFANAYFIMFNCFPAR